MLMRIATFETTPDVDPVRHAEFQRWLSGQPGLIALYYASDPSGKLVSVSIWASRDAMVAFKSQVFPGPPLALKPDSVAVYDVTSALGPGVAS